MATHLLRSIFNLIVLCSFALAVEQIWMAPVNRNYTEEIDFLPPFSAAARGEWFNSDIGIGSIAFPTTAVDSRKTLWIIGGMLESNYRPLHGVWNYNPKTDLYRWLWPANSSADASYNPGELGVASDLNSPGNLQDVSAAIDAHDNIWLLSASPAGELWLFNTSSWNWVRVQGLAGQTDAPSYGAVPGQAGDDVWPGNRNGHLLCDSRGDLWLLSGTVEEQLINHVWHFNTSARLWRFVSGNQNTTVALASNATYFGGLSDAACDMDEQDTVWFYGGYGGSSDVWSYNTRTDHWQHEWGNFEGDRASLVVSADYHADNRPSSATLGLFVDRKDGTLLLVQSIGSTSEGEQGALNTAWLYNTTLQQWKVVLGNTSATFYSGTYKTRREPGSLRPGVYGIGRHSGKNCDGDVYVVGGSVDTIGVWNNKDIWLLPQNQCSTTIHRCDPNATCFEELTGYACQCKEGFSGDGFVCSRIITPTAAIPTTATPQAVSSASQLMLWIFLAMCTTILIM